MTANEPNGAINGCRLSVALICSSVLWIGGCTKSNDGAGARETAMQSEFNAVMTAVYAYEFRDASARQATEDIAYYFLEAPDDVVAAVNVAIGDVKTPGQPIDIVSAKASKIATDGTVYNKTDQKRGRLYKATVGRFGNDSATVMLSSHTSPLAGSIYSVVLEKRGGRWQVTSKKLEGVQ